MYLKSGHLGAAARACAQATEAAAGLTPHHRVHAAGWQLILASVTGRWDEVRAVAAEAEHVVDANLAAATPCCLDVSILLNCATGRAQAGDEDEARRLEAKANGLGMEGGRCYQGWFEPPKIRLALARRETGQLAELASADFDWEWEPVLRPSWTHSPRSVTASESRRRYRSGCGPGSFAEPFAVRALGIARR